MCTNVGGTAAMGIGTSGPSIVENTVLSQESRSTATPESNRSVLSSLRSITDADNNINTASPKIKQVLDGAPVGTEITINAYYNNSVGQLQDVFTKKSGNKWDHTWRVKNGQIYWTNTIDSNSAADDVFNALLPD